MPLRVTFTLSDNDIRHFRRHMKQARATTAEMGEESIIRAAEGLLEEVSGVDLPDFIDERMQKLQVLIDILRDERWDLPANDRVRVLSGLAYFTDPHDIIPDSVPGVGYLDDAIMVELIVRELRHDIEGYEEFCEAEGPLQKAQKGTPEDQRRLQERRQRLQRRIHRRNRSVRGSRGTKGARLGLW